MYVFFTLESAQYSVTTAHCGAVLKAQNCRFMKAHIGILHTCKPLVFNIVYTTIFESACV